jgi:nitroreductase
MASMNEQPPESAEPSSVAQVVNAVICSRRAIRAFRPEPISRCAVAEILEVAATAPSNSNTQPWMVHVLAGEPKQALSDALLHAHNQQLIPAFAHFPDALPEPCSQRNQDFGLRYYRALCIDRSDAPARSRATGRNFVFFGAPIGLIFTIDARLKKHSWLDCGLFIQNIMIAAKARGLDTCPQVVFARYQRLIAEHLDLPSGHDVICGMSLGYADERADINRLTLTREPVERFASFLGFPE